MKLKRILTSLLAVLAVMVGILFIMSTYQLRDFEKLPLDVPYSQIHNEQ